MFFSIKSTKSFYPTALIAVTALTAGLLFSTTDLGKRSDGIFFDTTAPLLGQPRQIDNLLIVLITEKDYASAGIPLALWGGHLAPLLRKIASGGPEAVGIDMILPQFPLAKISKDYDQKILKSLSLASKSCRLVSGYAIASDGLIKEPFMFYQKVLGLDGYGYINLTPDSDGICRKQMLTLPTNGDRSLYSFSSLVAAQRFPSGTVIVPDWRNPARIPTLTFAQALSIDSRMFSDKLVLIGTDFEFEDKHISPASSKEEAGVIFQARVVEALRNGSVLLMPSWPYSLLAPLGLVVALTLCMTRRASQLKVVTLSVAVGLGLIGLFVLALALGFVLRPSAGFGGLVVVASSRYIQNHLKVKETFGRYVSREVRDEILSGRIPLDGEIKQATVLFADLRNFTPMVEAIPPKAVVRIMNTYFKAMADTIQKHGGLVLQYIGDELEAVFGAPVPTKNHASSAVKAALEMRECLEEVNHSLAQQGFLPLDNGIGIHTGELLAANMGGRDRVTYSLVGDTVNIASRLQVLNKEFDTKILISGETLAEMDEPISVKQMPTTPIKGKIRTVDIFAIL
ncbi:MAG: adenylate/guanylate cyclase domain-containing protein [Deltaproteobacteria bacterium]|nr:adenylate/guanylate cyclase domain-containing protein [Deltaproteobacteria bacterium]